MRETEWVRVRHQDRLELGIDDPTWRDWLFYWEELRTMPKKEGFNPSAPEWPERPE